MTSSRPVPASPDEEGSFLAEPRTWLSRILGTWDGEARVSLVAGTYAARVGLACAVSALVATRLDPTADGLHRLLDLGPAGMSLREVLAGLLVLLLVTTAVQVALGIALHLRRNRLPTPGHLTLGATLDVLWLVAGYIASGHSGIPFPPLMVLALGVHGVLLSAGRTIYVALLVCVLFVLAQVVGVFVQEPVFSPETQMALFVAIGLVSAVVGNRIRAAGWAMERLGRAIEGLTRHHEQVLEHLPAAVLVLEPDAGTVWANARMFSLIGAPKEADPDVLLDRLRRSLPGLEADLETAVTDATTTEPRTGGGTLGDQEREVIWTIVAREVPETDGLDLSALAAQPVAAHLEDPPQARPTTKRVVLLALHDVTAQREAERMRARADRYEAVAELSAGLAHEVRNPVAALRLSAEQLAEAEFEDPEDRDLVEIVLREARRLDGLAGEFLEYARVGAGEASRFRLDELVAECVEAVRGQLSDRVEGPTFRLDVPDAPLRADGDLVYRTVTNLLLNAAAFSPEGVAVEVTARLDRDEGHVDLVVRDHGPGIAPADRERVFRPFFTTRKGGSGLGLAVAARAATLLGGRLTVETPPEAEPTGEGVQFRLQFPVDVRSTPPSSPATQHDPGR